MLLTHFLQAALLPLVLLLIMESLLLNSRIRDSVFMENSFVSAAVTREISTFLQHINSVGLLVAAQSDKTDETTESLQGRLQNTVRMFPAFESLQILDMEGNVLAAAPYNSDLIGSNQSSQPYFPRALEENHVVWSNTFISPYSGIPTLAVAFPMRNGVLVGHIRLRMLSYIGSQTTETGKYKLIITNSQGKLLVHPNQDFIRRQKNIFNHPIVQATLNGDTGTFETEFEGKKVLCSSSHLRTTNWAVLVLQTKKDAFGLLWEMIFALIVLIALSGGLSMVLSYYSRRQITKPIYQLMETMRHIGEGNYFAFGPVRDDYREIRYLSDNMLQMASKIAQRESELKRNLDEKDVLVKEVHHRVKNNLQLVLSILNLKYTTIEDSAVRNAMYDNIGRIYTIAQVHEQLYSSESLAEIELSRYLNSLIAYLLSIEKYVDSHVHTDIRIERVLLNVDQAIPLGLIIFELVSNSMQHSFNSKDDKLIRLVCRQKDSQLFAEVGDNGSTFDPELFQNAETVGFSIILELIHQLGGSVEYERNDGNLFRISFPLA